jgi:SMODS-associated and fused to various effectors sensor domain
MSVSYISDWVKFCLWGKAAGRCQFDGCNHPLFRDDVTQAAFNSAYIAHIVADKPEGPRGHPTLSEALKSDLNNLMLLCDVHHRLVDKVDVAGHPVERLQGMKRKHEERMELLASISEGRHSQILPYGAKIGQHDSHLSFQKASAAMVPEYYPASSKAIEIGLKSSAFDDAEQDFWQMELTQLRRQFAALVKPRFSAGDLSHMSVFALAPMPLLIELGRLLSDIPEAIIYQLHREPVDWKWRHEPKQFAYQIHRPSDTCPKQVALVLALSADILPDRIEKVLGEGILIWTLTHLKPGNDFLHSSMQLREFRQALRDVFNQIKTAHGEDANLHLFPAVPLSAAVEIGRVWMPKADLPFRVYDQNRATGGFTFALDIQ